MVQGTGEKSQKNLYNLFVSFLEPFPDAILVWKRISYSVQIFASFWIRRPTSKWNRFLVLYQSDKDVKKFADNCLELEIESRDNAYFKSLGTIKNQWQEPVTEMENLPKLPTFTECQCIALQWCKRSMLKPIPTFLGHFGSVEMVLVTINFIKMCHLGCAPSS